MRSEEDAILVGYKTALLDNPRLNNRHGSGKQPIRIAIDPELNLSASLNLFDQNQQTIVFNFIRSGTEGNIEWIQLERDLPMAAQVVAKLENINSIIIEGGSKTLQLFIDEGLWDEAMIIRSKHLLQNGTIAPVLRNSTSFGQYHLLDNSINIYHHEHTAKLYRNQ
jgi:diaminohydroxyphosphoribosylaminopyrimidine deaminase/5-amino-6-(5-phosphoribosylamino)uracil reductase